MKKRIANQEELKSAVLDWSESDLNRADELIIIPNDIDYKTVQMDCFKLYKMIIKIQSDLDPFYKVTFVEILG
jgi:hypothetical protein